MKTKSTTAMSASFAKGGSTKMFPKMGATLSEPGVSQHTSPPGHDKNFAKGGSGKMHSQQGASPARPGQTSPSKAGAQPWGISGGSGHMAGFSGSTPAKPK